MLSSGPKDLERRIWYVPVLRVEAVERVGAQHLTMLLLLRL